MLTTEEDNLSGPICTGHNQHTHIGNPRQPELNSRVPRVHPPSQAQLEGCHSELNSRNAISRIQNQQPKAAAAKSPGGEHIPPGTAASRPPGGGHVPPGTMHMKRHVNPRVYGSKSGWENRRKEKEDIGGQGKACESQGEVKENLETAWRRMNCRQAAHVVTLIFLGLRMIRLAIGSEPPGAVLLLLFFSILIG
ncbi:hypothetical protein DEO72_LG3g847 [Vigna unguiculata]|uniref:Uncharacterized protein n=1 Tax=Vigna unguiculata TaxID=3917 RepID=A0A4D6LD51_VIGUN|nr:hypothetical protein DEO72_LG3g847 [Vigna unguiculata]